MAEAVLVLECTQGADLGRAVVLDLLCKVVDPEEAVVAEGRQVAVLVEAEEELVAAVVEPEGEEGKWKQPLFLMKH